MVTKAEVNKHTSKSDCWVIIKGVVYDLTSFLDAHPGGSRIILKYAGQDATEAFEPFHSEGTIEKYLPPKSNIGPVTDSDRNRVEEVKTNEILKATSSSIQKAKRVSIKSIINIRDFELAAAQLLPAKSFAFFKAGADDEFTAQWNRASWQVVRFRPRVLAPIRDVSLKTRILGTEFSCPFFICPAGGARLAHPTGELSLTRAAAKHDILHWVCNMAGYTRSEISTARDAEVKDQKLFWQIYALNELSVTEKEIKQAIELGYKGFALTVDAICAGKRERDVRMSLQDEVDHDDDDDDDDGFANQPTVKRSHVWTEFDWVSAITWLRGITDLPIAIKGIQTWEDAALCMHYGVHPWLSNHAGRQLDGAPSSVETLVAIRKNCPLVFEKCEVIVDGGITRGTDIVKALALGAKGVGLGRAFLYSLVFGEKGVSKAIRILKHEVETAMALLGVTSIDHLSPSHVDTSALKYASAIPRPYL